ncbi:HAD family hydrolase [bacterium]|nr:HAD family hydrolase [bacterium]
MIKPAIDITGIKAVLFDLGGTLIEYINNPSPDAYREFQNLLTDDDPRISYSDFRMIIERYWITMQDEFFSKDRKLKITDFNQAFFSQLGFTDESAKRLAKPFDDLIFELEHDSTIAIDGAIELLDFLKNNGYKIGLVSNATHSESRIRQLMRKVGIENYFETVVISSVIGKRKPDPRIFLKALDDLGVQASEALYIGDREEYDAVGAMNAGMRFAIVGEDFSLNTLLNAFIKQ